MSASDRVEIYRGYVEALMVSEGKRQSANQVYLSISLAIVTAFSTFTEFPAPLAAAMIAFVAVIWISTIATYRSHSRTKFRVIEEMEKELPFAPFTREWERMPDFSKKLGLTRLEMLAPVVLIVFAAHIYPF